MCADSINLFLPFRIHEIVTSAPCAFPPSSVFHCALSLSIYRLKMFGKESFAQRERVEIVDKLLPLPAQMVPLSRVYFF